jgi:enoyl-CoA hydratase
VTVRTELDGHIARLTLDRPDARNALSIELCKDIVAALNGISEDARVVVISGEGKVFCSGADFAAVSGPGAAEFLPAFERMLETVARFRLPTIASIHGAALGGGLQLATVCDFRIATRDTKFGIPSARLGIVVNFENVQRLVLLAGVQVAKDILMTGRVLLGDEARASGLLGGVLEDEEELAGATDALAEAIAANAPLSVQGAKRSIQFVVDYLSRARDADPLEAVEVDKLVTEAYASADLQEGLSAMSEKRPPNFRGH